MVDAGSTFVSISPTDSSDEYELISAFDRLSVPETACSLDPAGFLGHIHGKPLEFLSNRGRPLIIGDCSLRKGWSRQEQAEQDRITKPMSPVHHVTPSC